MLFLFECDLDEGRLWLVCGILDFVCGIQEFVCGIIAFVCAILPVVCAIPKFVCKNPIMSVKADIFRRAKNVPSLKEAVTLVTAFSN